MDRLPQYISLEDAVRKLTDQPIEAILQQKYELTIHMRSLRESGCVVSLMEYGKFFKARQLLEQVLKERRKNRYGL